MNKPQITDLITDAKLALETIECGKSPVFRAAAAAWLESIAKQLQGACAETEQEEQEEPPATIDVRMKYRTRDGREVRDLQDDGTDHWPINGIIKGDIGREIWGRQGNTWIGREDNNDLVPTGELA
jgi:hypothetical protein